MDKEPTFEQKELAARPINPSNGITYVDLSGQRWEFRYGRFCKTTTTRLSRVVLL